LVALLAELSRMLPAEQVAARRELLLAEAAKRNPGVVARVRAASGEVAAKRDAVGGVITWLFAPGGHAPVARVGRGESCAIVADQVGAPLVVVDERGEVRAQLVTDSRGRAEVDGDAGLCPWRFAGQYRDDETGLHYNRFRYYDAEAGQYVSRDPLGLRAGLRVYGYVGDPGVASDPLGLAPAAGEGCGGGDGETTRVGRWMSKAELEAMVESGKVQASAGGITHVTVPANPDAFAAAAPGSVFVEFDVASGRVDPGGREDWGIISGPDSPRGRLAKRKGEALEMPDATNIEVTAAK
jgi:RHS repeat-associated protein